MAAEPKISGSTTTLMIAQRIPMLKYNAALRFCGIEYADGFAGGCGDSGTELTLNIQAYSNPSLTLPPLITFLGKRGYGEKNSGAGRKTLGLVGLKFNGRKEILTELVLVRFPFVTVKKFWNRLVGIKNEGSGRFR
jgi:hypothetical protein